MGDLCEVCGHNIVRRVDSGFIYIYIYIYEVCQ